MNHSLHISCARNSAPCIHGATRTQICGQQRSVVGSHTDNKRLTVRSSAQQTQEKTTIRTLSDAPTVVNSPSVAESRRYFSLLPPFFSRSTTCEQLSEGLWSMTQPLKPPGQSDIRLRMVAARLDDGNLLLSGPIAPTAEVLDQLRALGGEVTHVIVPNTSPEHWLFAPALANALPNATFWFCPGFFEGKGVPLPGRNLFFRSQRKQCATLGVDPLPLELQGQVQTVLFDVPFFLEAAVCLPRHKVLLLADTGICLSANDPEYSSLKIFNVKLAEKIGIWDRLGPITRIIFEKYPEEGKAWVEKVLNECEFDTVVPAHGTAPVKDGRTAFKNCFDFLF